MAKYGKNEIAINLISKISTVFLILLLITPMANAALTAESAELSYQIEHSDRIVLGTVTDIETFYDYSIITVEVQEWLMNPLSNDTIKIQTFVGTNFDMEDEVRFTVDETTILMLTDKDLEATHSELQLENLESTLFLIWGALLKRL